MADSTGVEPDLRVGPGPRPGPGPGAGPRAGARALRRRDGPAQRPGGDRQHRPADAGQDPDQPELLGQPGRDRRGGRPGRDQARRHLAEGDREGQAHAQGDADLPGRHAGEGRQARQGLGGGRGQGRPAGLLGFVLAGLEGRDARRDGHGDVHLGLDRRPQGRGPLARQHPLQRPPDAAPPPSSTRSTWWRWASCRSSTRSASRSGSGRSCCWARRRSTTPTRSTPRSSATSARSTRSR